MTHTIQKAGEAFWSEGYSADTVFFFDFDGVLAAQDEEKLFRLPVVTGERNELEALAGLHGFDPALYPSTEYLRHIIYQAQVFDLPVEPHTEAVDFARNLAAQGRPHFIITARSSRYAVERMLRFCDKWELYPTEVFCLGRSSKADLLAKLRLDWPERPFVFFEDSEHHIQAAKALGDPNLEVVQIEWPSCSKNAGNLRRQHLGIH